MARFIVLAFMALALSSAHARRDLQGVKVTVRNDPTSPIFRSETSGGINISGIKGIDIADVTEVTAVKNVDKHTGEVERTFIKAEGSAVAVGKFADANVDIKTKLTNRTTGNLTTTVETYATGIKPKFTAVDASIEQKQVATGFFPGPNVTVIADSRAAVEAAQVEKKANSGVTISATTLALVDTAQQTSSAKQSTSVSDFDTSIHNPIPHTKQNQTTFGQVTAIDKNGNIVFQDGTFPPQP